jgi:glycerol-3-phosphate acyltransferase PlsY
VLTLVLDALKGYVAVVLALLLKEPLGLGGFAIALVGLAAFLGHLWPVFFRFQGGKGVATAAGVLLALNPLLGLATLVSWLLVAGFMRYSSLAALVAAAFAPFFQMMVWGMEPVMACIVPMSLLLIWRHAANIRKLLDGTETKIGQKSAAKAASKAGRKA